MGNDSNQTDLAQHKGKSNRQAAKPRGAPCHTARQQGPGRLANTPARWGRAAPATQRSSTSSSQEQHQSGQMKLNTSKMTWAPLSRLLPFPALLRPDQQSPQHPHLATPHITHLGWTFREQTTVPGRPKDSTALHR